MITLNQGKVLGPGDIGINIRDNNANLYDPASISYSIFQVGHDDSRTLVSAPNMPPVRYSTGTYYIGGAIPTTWHGKFNLVWYLKETNTSPQQQVFEEFEVHAIDPAKSSFEAPSVLVTPKPGLDAITAAAVMMVRELISDENPDRNYSFRPPTPGIAVANFNNRVGFIWVDSTIIRMLNLAVSMLNTWNPMGLTNYTLQSMPQSWRDAAAVGAAWQCLGKEAARWSAEGFSYSLNGISLDINKASEYQALASSLQQEFETWAALITANRPFSAGLRQNRWLL